MLLMIQQFIHFNLWFVHLCLDQIDHIDIQEGRHENGKRYFGNKTIVQN